MRACLIPWPSAERVKFVIVFITNGQPSATASPYTSGSLYIFAISKPSIKNINMESPKYPCEYPVVLNFKSSSARLVHELLTRIMNIFWPREGFSNHGPKHRFKRPMRALIAHNNTKLTAFNCRNKIFCPTVAEAAREHRDVE